MGFDASAIRRMRRERDLFVGRDVLSLGLFKPYLLKSQVEKMALQRHYSGGESKDFASSFLRHELGVRSVSSLDVDSYQGADIVCNLNKDLDPDLNSKYDLILDLGTLEHLSDFSIAFRNIFQLLRPGGIYYFAVPCNNWMNHGFFQISPTFFFDLCACNDSLYGRNFCVMGGSMEVPFESYDKYVARAFMKARVPLVFGGNIVKEGSDINLDLVQSKYRSSYTRPLTAPSEKTPMNNRRARPKWRNALSKFPGLPLSVRLSLLLGFNNQHADETRSL
jgi:SAM-dependent methyltransferase